VRTVRAVSNAGGLGTLALGCSSPAPTRELMAVAAQAVARLSQLG
jgi:NAD(P)H-dependent flavin oxidoreductase YrpB (nitropropane dioxygenase family)